MAVTSTQRWTALALGAAAIVGLTIYGIVWLRDHSEEKKNDPPVVQPKSEPDKPKLVQLPANIERVLEPKPADGMRHQLTRPWSSGKIYFTQEPMTFNIQRDYDQRLAIEVENRSKEGLKIVAEIGRLDDGLLGDFSGLGSADHALELAAGAKHQLSLHLFAQDARRSIYHSYLVIRDAGRKEVLATAPLVVQVPLPSFALRTELGPPDPGTLARELTITNDGGPLTDLAVALGESLVGKAFLQPSVDHAYLVNGQQLKVAIHPRLSTSFKNLGGDLVIRAAGQEKKVAVRIDLPTGKSVFVAHSFSTTSDHAAGSYCTNNPNTNTPIGGPTANKQPCPKSKADCFGLPAGNERISEPGVPRLYKNNVAQHTVTQEYVNAHPDEDIRIHYGIDFTSRVFGKDKKGKPTTEVKKMDFTACVEGKVTGLSGGTWNTISVTLSNGNVIQYLHASAVKVKVGDDVTPDTVLGVTGDSGSPGRVHLHVQAKDKNGKYIDPDCAIADKPNESMPTLPKKATPKKGGASPPAAKGGKGKGKGGAGTAAPKPPSKAHADFPAHAPMASASPFRPNPIVNAPRGGVVRPAYALYRNNIYDNNAPEAMSVYADGAAGTSVLLQTWHSDRDHEMGMRRIWVGAWDRLTGKNIVAPRPLCDEGLVQWPALLALPGQRALVVWETVPRRPTQIGNDGVPALAYSVSDPGYLNWSAPTLIPDTQKDDLGNFDPVPVVDAKGNIVLVWQHGVGSDARVMFARSSNQGAITFAAPMTAQGLPAGASRPVPRFDSQGALHLVFEAPADPGMAVYHAVSKDGGAAFAAVQRLSPVKIDAGEADLLSAGKSLHAVFRSGASRQSRIEYTSSQDQGKTWAPPLPVTGDDIYAEYPSLFQRADGKVGVEFYGDKRGPIEKKPRCCNGASEGHSSLKRFETVYESGKWTAPGRLLTNFPAVESAWLQVDFRLRTPRTLYKPHDLSILVNGVEVVAQTGVIPEGTYLVPIDPALLHVDENGLAHNMIGLRTRHMNPGSYQTAADFRLLARHSFLERLVVASDQKEADALLAQETPRINHDRPDVGLFVPETASAIPALPKKDEKVTVKLVLGNLGEACAKNTKIEVFDEPPSNDGKPRGKPLGAKVDCEKLKPMEFRDITVEFPFGGKEHYYIVAQVEGTDFDLNNNLHVISFATFKPPTYSPLPFNPTQELTVELADDTAPPYRCRILSADKQEEVAVLEWGQLKGAVPTGKYQLALTRHEKDRELLFPDVIEHTAGQNQRVVLRTAIEVAVPEWAARQTFTIELPGKLRTPIFKWDVVKAGKPDEVVQTQYGWQPVMLVPPGEYQVAVTVLGTSEKDQRFLWPTVVKIAQDEHVVLNLDSGIILEAPRWAGPLWRWDRVPDAKGKGTTTVGVGPVFRWEVTPASKSDEIVRWHYGTSPVMLLPPGEYRVAIKPTYLENRRLLWPQVLKVEAGAATVLSLDSGLRVELPSQASEGYRWYAANAHKPGEVLMLQDPRHEEMLLPPGKYRVGIQPIADKGETLLWPDEVEVKAGASRVLKLASGLRITAGDKAREGEFRVLDAAGKKSIQWGVGFGTIHPLPPGKYTVLARDGKAAIWLSTKTPVEIDKDQVAELKLGELMARSGKDADQERAEALALIDRAAKAVGDPDKLNQYKAFTWKSKTTSGADTVSHSEHAAQWPDRFRSVNVSEFKGQKFKSVIVQNGTKIWQKTNDMPATLLPANADALAHMQVVWWVFNPALLKTQPNLVLLGESDVQGRPALGLAAAEKDRPEVRLFFDKESGLLVKSEMRRTYEGLPMPLVMETLYGDYKEAGGIRFPMLWTSIHNGKRIGESRCSEFTPLQKLDDKLFGEP